jgi:hypothetical protein
LANFMDSEPPDDDERTTTFVRKVFPMSFLNAREHADVMRLYAFLNENKLIDRIITKRAEADLLLEAVRRA